jgi:nitrate reductase gamma subunit
VTLLDFARGPAFFAAFTILIVGLAWRASGLVLMRIRKDFSKPRDTHFISGGLRTVAMRSVPPHELEKNIVFQHFTGYAWHIGWFVTFLFLGSHLPFIRSVLGFAWPGLPNGIILVIAAITLGILTTLYVRRLFHPVLRLITDADDHISVLLTIAPLVTGVAAFAHWSPLGVRYESMLAVHLLSVETLMVWLPFGKIFHVVTALVTRFRLGAAFIRRGVRA